MEVSVPKGRLSHAMSTGDEDTLYSFYLLSRDTQQFQPPHARDDEEHAVEHWSRVEHTYYSKSQIHRHGSGKIDGENSACGLAIRAVGSWNEELSLVLNPFRNLRQQLSTVKDDFSKHKPHQQPWAAGEGYVSRVQRWEMYDTHTA